jgi:hypothetical protein
MKSDWRIESEQWRVDTANILGTPLDRLRILRVQRNLKDGGAISYTRVFDKETLPFSAVDILAEAFWCMGYRRSADGWVRPYQ